MGACAKVWPPVLASGTPKATGGASASDLGTVSRGGGAKQVTYMGHPLYYYAADSGPGMTKGQGSNSFGAKWWLVSTSGSAITRGGSASTSGGASTPSSRSSGGGGWG
jgi:predicted lipoprotein with Yx(FWY)xxD motif